MPWGGGTWRLMLTWRAQSAGQEPPSPPATSARSPSPVLPRERNSSTPPRIHHRRRHQPETHEPPRSYIDPVSRPAIILHAPSCWRPRLCLLTPQRSIHRPSPRGPLIGEPCLAAMASCSSSLPPCPPRPFDLYCHPIDPSVPHFALSGFANDWRPCTVR